MATHRKQITSIELAQNITLYITVCVLRSGIIRYPTVTKTLLKIIETNENSEFGIWTYLPMAPCKLKQHDTSFYTASTVHSNSAQDIIMDYMTSTRNY